jgi:hypothetical protein
MDEGASWQAQAQMQGKPGQMREEDYGYGSVG